MAFSLLYFSLPIEFQTGNEYSVVYILVKIPLLKKKMTIIKKIIHLPIRNLGRYNLIDIDLRGSINLTN